MRKNSRGWPPEHEKPTQSNGKPNRVTAQSIFAVTQARKYADLGIEVVPLYSVVNGVCGCQRGARCGSHAGKHPLTPNGVLGASSDLSVVRRRWELWPDSNVGIRLDPLLFDLSSDCEYWAREFKRRGMEPTWLYSSGGRWRWHAIYRRPPDCPITSSHKSGEYDIKTNGLAVAPPSVHYTGAVYQWQHDWPHNLDDLPYAPDWAVEMLVQKAASRGTPAGGEINAAFHASLSITPNRNLPPPVTPFLRPSQYCAYQRWYNARNFGRGAYTLDGELDRSWLLVCIGKDLIEECGITEAGEIALHLAERDLSLNLGKYSTRSAYYAWKAYLDTAHESIAAVERKKGFKE